MSSNTPTITFFSLVVHTPQEFKSTGVGYLMSLQYTQTVTTHARKRQTNLHMKHMLP
jgi:hypothetical protein